MPLPQSKFRELVFQLLFALDGSQSCEKELTALLMGEIKTPKKEVEEGIARAKSILGILEEIDGKITHFSKDYALERIHNVEKNVLRISIYEFLYDKITPPAVVISEAIRLTKKFSTPDGSRFVHALLDKIYQEIKSDDPLSASKECSAQ